LILIKPIPGIIAGTTGARPRGAGKVPGAGVARRRSRGRGRSHRRAVHHAERAEDPAARDLPA
jgi:hypothetical protein